VGWVADRMEVKEGPEECDRIVREANSTGTWVPNITGDEDVDELSGEPVGKLFSRGKFGRREWIFGFEAPYGKRTGDGSSSDDTAPKEAGDVMWLQKRVPVNHLGALFSTPHRISYLTCIQTVRYWPIQGRLSRSTGQQQLPRYPSAEWGVPG